MKAKLCEFNRVRLRDVRGAYFPCTWALSETGGEEDSMLRDNKQRK